MKRCIKEAHAKVWKFRREYGDIFKTPGVLDTARFAHMEVMEAVDALVRSGDEGYARNSEKSLDTTKELADTAMMLMTLGKDITAYTARFSSINNPQPNLDDLSVAVALVHMWAGAYIEDSEDYPQAEKCMFEQAASCLEVIAEMIGEDSFVKAIEDCLSAIYEKRIKNCLQQLETEKE